MVNFTKLNSIYYEQLHYVIRESRKSIVIKLTVKEIFSTSNILFFSKKKRYFFYHLLGGIEAVKHFTLKCFFFRWMCV